MKVDKNNPRVIYLNYEDLVLKYDETIEYLFNKIGIDPDMHIKKNEHFEPFKSMKNVKIWEEMKDTKEIKLIEKELKDYLY